MQLASASATKRSDASDRVYAAIDRDYAAIRRSRKAIFDRPSKRPTTSELAEYYANVCRNADGSIDFDSYRKRASAFRGREVRNGALLGWACASILTLCCACAVIFAIASVNAPAPSARSFNTTIVSTQP